MAVVDLSIDTVDSGIEVAVSASESGPAELRVKLTGSAELPSVEVMGRLVGEVHREAQARSAAAVVVDVTELEFMNSSCFKALVGWVNDVTELDDARRYQIRFRSNPGILWQRRSLHVLKTMATHIISIES